MSLSRPLSSSSQDHGVQSSQQIIDLRPLRASLRSPQMVVSSASVDADAARAGPSGRVGSTRSQPQRRRSSALSDGTFSDAGPLSNGSFSDDGPLTNGSFSDDEFPSAQPKKIVGPKVPVRGSNVGLAREFEYFQRRSSRDLAGRAGGSRGILEGSGFGGAHDEFPSARSRVSVPAVSVSRRQFFSPFYSMKNDYKGSCSRSTAGLLWTNS